MNYLTFIFAITLTSALAQSETTGALKSCNVVCNCNSGQSRGTVDPPNRQVTNQGPTGKLGPKGDPGSVGVKGEKVRIFIFVTAGTFHSKYNDCLH